MISTRTVCTCWAGALYCCCGAAGGVWRSGGLFSRPTSAMGPCVVQLDQGWSAAALHWQELGCPYDAALALADGDEPAMRQALQTFEVLGARPMAGAVARRLRELGVA